MDNFFYDLDLESFGWTCSTAKTVSHLTCMVFLLR